METSAKAAVTLTLTQCDTDHHHNPITSCWLHTAPLQKFSSNLSIINLTSYPSDKQWVKYAVLGKGKHGFLNMYADTDKSVHLFLSLVSELRSMAKLDSTVPSVSGHCWLRVRNGIRPTKNLPPANLRGSSL